MNPYSLPAISIVATPTKRSAILQLAQEAESRGFAGLACPSLGATLGLCTSLAHATSTIRFWTSIQPVYYNHPVEMSNTAAHIHEISGGRFGIGLGVSHAPVVQRLGVTTGKPLSDMSDYVAAMRQNSRFSGELPPYTLRRCATRCWHCLSILRKGPFGRMLRCLISHGKLAWFQTNADPTFSWRT